MKSRIQATEAGWVHATAEKRFPINLRMATVAHSRVVAGVILLSATTALMSSVSLSAPRPSPGERVCYFGGALMSRPINFPDQPALRRVTWSLEADHRPLLSGEVDPARRLIEFQLPEVKTNSILALDLKVTAMNAAGDVFSSTRHPVMLFPPHVFADQLEVLKKLDIHVYDPEEKLSAFLQELEVPFKVIHKISILDSLSPGTHVIIGQGLDGDAERGLFERIRMAALRGLSIMMLAPASGSFVLSENAIERPTRMAWEDMDVLRQLNKLLTDVPPLLSSFSVSSGRAGAIILVSRPGDGWPWVRLWHENTCGELVLCGFDFIGLWEASPVPRYALAAWLFQIKEKTNDHETLP